MNDYNASHYLVYSKFGFKSMPFLKPFLHEQFLFIRVERAKLGNFWVANSFFEKLAC
jgi:hypothetical protein